MGKRLLAHTEARAYSPPAHRSGYRDGLSFRKANVGALEDAGLIRRVRMPLRAVGKSEHAEVSVKKEGSKGGSK